VYDFGVDLAFDRYSPRGYSRSGCGVAFEGFTGNSPMPRGFPPFVIRITVVICTGIVTVLFLPALFMSARFLPMWVVPLEFVAALALYRVFRCSRRKSALCFGIVALVANAASFLLCVYLRNIGGVFLMLVVSMASVPAMLGVGAAWAMQATEPNAVSRRSSATAWTTILSLAFAPLTMLCTPWPLLVAFQISRPILETIADRVATGRDYGRPQWAGLFYVVGSAVDPGTGNVGLIIGQDACGRSGFVRVGRGVPIEENSRPFVGLNFNDHLGGRWAYQNED
jgi:hypothetical protein